MKKYISPVARTIILFEEHELMQVTSPMGEFGTPGGFDEGYTDSGGESNRRSIWDNTEW